MSIVPARKRMTAVEFIAWAMQQPEGERYELVDGEVVAMSPERVGHLRTKALVWQALRTAVTEGGPPCEVLPDGATVVIDEATVYELDALVRCGEPLDEDAVVVPDPVVIVEVVSPSTREVDTSIKLDDYFRLPSVRHYLIVNPKRRVVRHHRRGDDATIESRILGEGVLDLDLPGITVPVERFFAG